MMGWLGGWQYRKSHVINSAEGAGTNYQVRIKAHYGSGTDSGEDVYLNSHCRTDFGDVRFTDDDGVTLLDYWMEEKVDSDYAVFWIEVADDLSSSNATIYIYYGKSDAATTSNGDNTFIYFDDFSSDTTSDYTKTGTKYQGTTPSMTYDSANEHVELSISAGGHGLAYRSGETCGAGKIIEVKAKYTTSTGNEQVGVGLRGSTKDLIARGTSYQSGSYDRYIQIKEFTSGGATTVAINQTYGFDSNFHVISLGILSNTVKMYVDYTEELSASYTAESGDITLFIAYNTNSEGVFDNFKVRKFTYPEPSHGSWGSEEAAGGQTYEVNVDAVVQSHATITKETIFNVEKDASVSGQSFTAQEVGFNVVRDALVQASVAMQVLGVYPFNVEALVGASADAQFRQTLGISRDAAVAVVSAPLFQSMFNVGSDTVVGVVAEVGVVKEGEVKVTRVFLVLGDLAIQIQGD